ncbi:MAG: PSD1 domain-containing protein [Planctomycetaceae bacterium]|nr:PSD1 domain-containing protein [Planctomycetaceae bacterium]MCB9953378.1 PSD1 domain-containing protein [Planctomycetaceae bacterium]
MSNVFRSLFQCIAACCVALAAQCSFADSTTELTFEKDIRPIFREFCFDCHGATDKLEGQLDLRLVRFMQRGGESGPAIVVGDPANSYLVDRLRNGEMPPGETRVPDDKIAILEQWITSGAPTSRPEPESIGPGVPISVEDRSYWAFQPIQRPDVPNFDAAERVRTPIDALLRKAMPAGLSFSPDANRETLIQRAYFDLIGLPPTLEEMAKWKNHASEDWFDLLLNDLLDSPRYGERWGRHWLDVAGYADSEGYTVQDAERPWAWKYRDYVIRSLNADKPFNQFIVEQLAGDELAGPQQGDWTPAQIELLTATGFLRMAADGTGSGDNSPEARNKVIADTIKIVSTSLLGMSVACAQCHDHRYDPISQVDYYAMRAVFEPALDWQQWKNPAQRQVSLYTAADRQLAAEVEAEAQQVAAEKTAKQTEYMAQALAKELEKYEEPLKGELRTAYETAAKDRTPEQNELLKKYPSVNISPGVLYQYIPESKEELQKFDTQIAEIRAKKPVEQFVRVLSEPVNHTPVTKLFHRGDHQQPLQDVAPAALTIAAPEGESPEFSLNDDKRPSTGRRLAYAQWLTNGKHPLVARVIVNRVWMHHFGRGLVSTPADFGRLGDSPTHPELLDWLADEFMREGWSLKKLHRVILTSTAWRQSSFRDEDKDAIDAENRYYWRKSLQRLEAEIIRDRMLAAADSLNPELFGAPVSIKEDDTGQVIVDGPQKRRSLYIRVRRSQPVAMLQAFDAPVMETNCERRPSSTVATQSLMLMNGEFTLEQAKLLADRIVQEAQPLPAEVAALLPVLPEPLPELWSFGSGRFDETSGQTTNFVPLPHWTGSEWQGGPQRPDPNIGWVIVNANGGHPGNPNFGAVRRWTAPRKGTVAITGTLQHGSENGDGVRGRVISSRTGVAGEWQAFHSSATSNVAKLEVEAGDTIDFVTDCKANENSDTFSWPVKLTFQSDSADARTFDSVAEFHGPVSVDDYAKLPAEIQTAWRFILLRDPNPDELQTATEFAARQLTAMHENPAGVPSGLSTSRQVLVNVCQALLNSNEFLYVD